MLLPALNLESRVLLLPGRLRGCLLTLAVCLFGILELAPVAVFAQAEEADVTAELGVKASGYVFNRRTNTFDSTVTLRSDTRSITAPVKLIVTNISAPTVSLANSSGTSEQGNPYVYIPLESGTLAKGQSTTVVLKFTNANRLAFTYSARVVASVGDIGRIVVFPPPSALPFDAIDALPSNPVTGRPILFEVADGSLELDTERTPIVAVGACMHWITSCYVPGERELDDCARSAPNCSTNTPWLEHNLCCPGSCFGQYKARRLAGVADSKALLDVYVTEGSCFPQYSGVR